MTGASAAGEAVTPEPSYSLTSSWWGDLEGGSAIKGVCGNLVSLQRPPGVGIPSELSQEVEGG